MTLAQKLQQITDSTIAHGIEEKNQKILNDMEILAQHGKHYITYPITDLSNDFITYLDKEGLRLYGRANSEEDWVRTYPQNFMFPIYNEIMIVW